MDAEALKSIPLFARLSRREREQVSRWADEFNVAEGRHLVDQGELAYEFFAILEGTAEVLRDREHVADLGPGDFFGELALLTGEHRRTASVVATSPMRIIVMLRRDFQRMYAELPGVCGRIHKAVRERSP